MSRRLPPLVSLLAILAALALSTSTALALSPPAYVTQWGTFGSGNGQFKDVSGVAVDGGGNVYTIETVNNRVQKFTSTGTYITQWGTAGSGNGQFSGPYGIAVSGNDVYVVDTGNNRVQKFTTAGVYVSQFGTAGTGNGQFQQPLCAAVDASGNVYVTDYNLHRVQKFTSAGAYVLQWGSFGTGTGLFNGPAGICVDGFGYVYVCDSGNHTIQGFTPSGGWITQWGFNGTGNGQYNYPFGIATNGTEIYVVDTVNNRMQIETGYGTYLTQWGSAGAGNGQFNDPHNAAVDGLVVYVADTENNRIQKFAMAPNEECATCLSPPDTCCEALPRVGGPWTNVVVGTRQPSTYSGNPYSVALYDLNSSPTPAEDNNWASVTRYYGPGNSWTGDSLGTVFGLTLDEYGNIFVTHTSCYYGDLIGQVLNAGPGAVYRIDGTTGKITTFVKLPNFPDGSLSTPEDLPGLGNITYDCTHKQFFVTNLEDGKIYRIQPVGVNGPTGTVVETFDPLAPDNSLPGFAPIGERLWGVQWHANRVYYGVWAQDQSEGSSPNEVRSVALQLSGAFATGTDQHELFLPLLASQTFSMPVSDISFSASGKMLLAERGISGKTMPSPHTARVLEYACSGGCWLPANKYRIGACCGQENSAGGCDYDRQSFSGPGGTIGRVWASGDALHLGTPYTDVIYGYQGLRPNLGFGSNLTSMLIDSDGLIVDPDKTYIGDIEAPGCAPVSTGAICGQKYYDTNRNGVKDGGESGLSNWTIQLNGPGGPYTAVTDMNGNYCFTNLPPGSYTIFEIGLPTWIQTGPPGGTYSVSVAAGQTLYLKDFGNSVCGGAVGGNCVQPPPMMVAWWPFNEATSSTSASDVTHMSPARNVAQLFGGAAISNSGMVQRALCFPNELAYARVPNPNQLGTGFGAGPFAIDAWVNPNPSGASNRMIVEKRRLITMSPYKTLGWALYMNGQQLFLELGIGIATQIIPGPTIPPSTWSHIAVSVDRTPAAGRWYVNGAVQAAFNFVPTSGPVTSTADIYMGQVSPPFGVATGFNGCIDELELLNTPASATPILPASSVAAIYNAGGLGKCPDYVSLPSITTICKTQTSVQVCFNICNNSATPQTYHWSLAGLPVGPGCSVAGPTVFNPPAGSVTVPPGCSGPICVTIPRPAGLTTNGATSCFALTFVNDATGACYSRSSTIRADFGCWCVTPPASPVAVLAGPAGTIIGIPVGHPCDQTGILSYVITPAWGGTDHPDPMELRLNGLPPGEPVIGTLSVAPNGSGQISVSATFPDGYDMEGRRYELHLEADTDADGVPDPVGSVSLQSTYDESGTVSVPAPVAINENLQLVMSPNPFLGGSALEFRLSQADDVELGVYDLSGRQVRSLQHGRLAAGEHRIAWNGRDEHGRRVPAGVYFVRLDATGRHVEAKLVKLQ